MTMRASHVSLAGRICGIFPGVAEVGRERLDPIEAENACVPYNMIRLPLLFYGRATVSTRAAGLERSGGKALLYGSDRGRSPPIDGPGRYP